APRAGPIPRAPRARCGRRLPPPRPRTRRGRAPPGSCRSRGPPSPAVPAQGLDELLVAGCRGVVGRFVLLGVLRHDEGRPEVSVSDPAALDDGAPALSEEIRRRALVADRNRRGPVGERERQVERAGLPLERSGHHHPAEPIRLPRHGGRAKLSRRHEVDHRLRHAGVDHVRERARDDRAAHDKFCHWSGCLESGLGRGWPEIGAAWLRSPSRADVACEPGVRWPEIGAAWLRSPSRADTACEPGVGWPEIGAAWLPEEGASRLRSSKSLSWRTSILQYPINTTAASPQAARTHP